MDSLTTQAQTSVADSSLTNTVAVANITAIAYNKDLIAEFEKLCRNKGLSDSEIAVKITSTRATGRLVIQNQHLEEAVNNLRSEQKKARLI